MEVENAACAIIPAMTIKCYQLKADGTVPLGISASTLDEMTQALPPGFYTTFTTLAAGTRVLGLKFHLQRLYIPAREFGVRPALDETALRQQVAEITKENLPKESRLRLILTRERGDVYSGVEPFVPLPRAVYENGVRVITTDLARRNPRIKDTRFIAQSLVQRQMLSKDVFEVLLAKNGKILEGMTSNFYALRKSSLTGVTLITARYGILPGITRRIALRLARGQGIHIEYRAPRVDEDFEEAFLTSSSRGIVPVVQIDDVTVGQGRVGELTKQLSAAYEAYVLEKAERI
jgi:branched-chain amino acid aminotransferase